MEVIDGQHRLKAAEQLGLYVHFVVDDHINKGDIAAINSNAKNWTILDYINYWSTEKAEGFDKLVEFMLTYPKVQVSSAIFLVSAHDRNLYRNIREGNLKVVNTAIPELVAAALQEYSEEFHCKFAYEDKFVRAVTRMFKTEGYDHNNMRRRVEEQPRSLVRCVDIKQYVEMLEEIYNYRSSKNRLSFR